MNMKSKQDLIACPICHVALVKAPQQCQDCKNFYWGELIKTENLNTFMDMTPEAVDKKSREQTLTNTNIQNFADLLFI